MPTIRPRSSTDAAIARRAAPDDDDANSIAQALRAVLVFLALVGFLAWAGIAESISLGAPSGTGITAKSGAGQG